MTDISQGLDGVKLTLNFHQRQMLRFIALRGGETKFTFGTPPQPPPPGTVRTETQELEAVEAARGADESMRAMAKPPLNVVDMLPLIGPTYGKDTYLVRSNDIGRQVIKQMGIEIREGGKMTALFDPTTGKEIIGGKKQ